MKEIKHTDQEALMIFSSFLINVLTDKAGAAFYKNQLNEIQGYQQFYEENYFLNAEGIGEKININDKNQYIVVSGGNESFGIIVKITSGICSTLGYKMEEVLGKDLSLIMPSLFFSLHTQVLQNKINAYKKFLLDEESANSSEKHNSKFEDKRTKMNQAREITVFAKNKARYLVPISQKVSLVPSKNEDHYAFLSKIKFTSYREYNICYILTNTNFVIQNYTANMLTILKIDMNLIELEVTKVIDIMPELLEFEQEYSVSEGPNVSEKNDKTYQQKLIGYLIETFYEPKLITWKLNHHESDTKKFNSQFSHSQTKKSSIKTAQNQVNFIQRNQLRKSTGNIAEKIDEYILKGIEERKKNEKVDIMVSVFEEKIMEQVQGLVFKVTKFVENSGDNEEIDEVREMKEIGNKWKVDDLLNNDNDFKNEYTPLKDTFIPENNSHFILDSIKNSYFEKV